ncbi:MAG: anaerobic ribonucleoside-triphosphate reductase activating protein [Erysipelotrichaceae bacterium]|jgi:anaerobic ribonucleoside-triphosphate reductase activating protein|nr:anaerobic ribonucleoside-triphosphate reductase activating protein [Erysipelotrichaceae bacterium]
MFSGIQKLSLVDYDNKVSCVLFKSGCNFRCPFCHNASLVLNGDKDIISFEDIVFYLKKRKGVIDAVVISGGEPTLDKELVSEIAEIKKLGYLIKLDTNGSNPRIIEELINNKLIDYVAMDIKNSFSKYYLTTGIKEPNLNSIKESIHIIMNSKIDYEFRTTLVKEFHDAESIKGLGELIYGAKKIYLQKFVDSENTIVHGLNEVSKIDAEEFSSLLAKYVLKVELRGY